MKTIFFPLLLSCLVMFALACNKDNEPSALSPEEYQVSGRVEKGPFVKGSQINVYELTADLSPTGRSFTASITDNSGSFNLGQIELASPFIELVAQGYFYNEFSGELSDSQITLRSVVDLRNKSSVNVNIITHLMRDRIIALFAKGKSFSDAYVQAQMEVMKAFALQQFSDKDAITFSVVSGTDQAAALIVVSATLLKDRAEGSFTEYMAELQAQLKVDGAFSEKNKQELWSNASSLKLDAIAKNLVNRYTSIGEQITVKDLNYFVDWDGDGIAGNEMGNPNEEKHLAFETDTLRIGKEGGDFSVKIRANLRYNFKGPQNQEESLVLIEPSTFKMGIGTKDMNLTRTLNIEDNTLNIKIEPASSAFMNDSSITVYSSNGLFSSTLVLRQEGDMDKFEVTETVKQHSHGLLLSLRKATDNLYAMEAFYSRSYPEPGYHLFYPFYNHSNVIGTSVLQTAWGRSYAAINQINTFIRIIGNEHYSPVYKTIFGNLRAMIYYQLAILWGNVPYVDRVVNMDEAFNIPQLSETEILDKLENELSEAYKLFPAQSADKHIYPSRDVPAALLAKIHMQRGAYHKALQYINYIIDSANYALNTNASDTKSELSTELIYAFDMRQSNNLYVNYVENIDFLPISRYSEILLLAAECNYRINDKQQGLAYLNMIRKRNKMANATISNFELLLKQTWKVELKGEFSYFAFLKRNNISQQELGIEPYQELFPLPQSEIYANPNLHQNPGY
ncbi:Starch-binding associating with outer membrane [Saccharicrinis carchari]|uniref:Starch-binding associating with outer membrane n=1 Tax=Saccharicrinis carchari TaxID=1168039 RepID=A0A521AXY2_SACCC|nr:RagB/SusD family nutrient uptake outer membrane protein [Saccharicrinis carchari]SMO39370.1 Starch-binding associating with outer membrane [Saccharicrinis carchari]